MRTLALIPALFAVGLTRHAEAEVPGARIEMHVTEVSGDIAFVDAGDVAGLAAGMPARFEPARGKPVVVEVNAKTAAIQLDGATVAVGETLYATRPALHVQPKLADNTGQWPDPVLPASIAPAPTPVEISGPDGRRVSLAIIGHAFGAVGQGYRRGEGELRVIGSFQLLRETPLGADLDAAARFYAKGYNANRAPLLVRAAVLRYGDTRSPDVAIGRLRYAATSLGMLDGGRAALHTSHFELAAFGGLVPDPIDGRPDTTASRFGAEMIYTDDESALRPRVAVTAHASTWDGTLDERRVNLAASMVHGSAWLDAWTEVQSFAQDAAHNPFGASSVEVVGAGASVEWRRRDAHLGADLTYLVPERSLRIAALIPEWLCSRTPTMDPVEPCAGNDRAVASTVSAGFRGDTWAVDGAGSIAYTHETEARAGGSGYLRGELWRGIASVHVAASGGRAGFADWIAGELGVGVAPSKRFDATIAYRPERLDEKPAKGVFGTEPDIVHSIVADLHARIAPSLDVGAFLLGSFGANREAFAGLLTFAWRP